MHVFKNGDERPHCGPLRFQESQSKPITSYLITNLQQKLDEVEAYSGTRVDRLGQKTNILVSGDLLVEKAKRSSETSREGERRKHGHRNPTSRFVSATQGRQAQPPLPQPSRQPL